MKGLVLCLTHDHQNVLLFCIYNVSVEERQSVGSYLYDEFRAAFHIYASLISINKSFCL